MLRISAVAGLAFMVVLALFSPGRCEEPKLVIVPGQANSVKVELSNATLVRGVQFTLSGAKITEVRTTERTKGFLAKFNEKSGKVLMVSASGANIPPGTGSIAEIICDKPKGASISEVTIVKGTPPVTEGKIPDKEVGGPQKNIIK